MKETNINDRVLIFFLAIFLCSLLFCINYFVAPLSDESFPIATALRFLRGQSPFVDDYSPYIPLGLLIAPIVKLSLMIHKGTDGLILFLRHSYLAVTLITCFYTFFLTRKSLPFLLCSFIALANILFHPFSLNNFHYDTLATLLWSNILLQLYSFQFFEKVNKIQLCIFSLFNIMLCLAYPTFAFFLIMLYLCYYRYNIHSKKIFYSNLIMAVFFTAILFWVIFSYFNVSSQDIYKTLDFSHRLFALSSQDGLLQKFIIISQRLVNQYLQGFLISSIALLVASYYRKNYMILLPCLLFIIMLPFFYVNLNSATYIDAFYVINSIGFLSVIIFIFFLKNDPVAKRLFYFIGLPSFAAGVLAACTSFNLDLNFIIGFFPAFILTYALLFFVVQHNIRNDLISNIFSRFFLILGLSQLAFFQWNYIYGSQFTGINLYQNTKKMEMANPFQGLYMTLDTHNLINTLHRDIKFLDKTNQFVYFGHFSSGYLFIEHLKPGEYILFSPYRYAHFGEKIRTPSYVFDFSKTMNLPSEDIITYLSGESFKKIVTRPFYDIYSSQYEELAVK